MGGGVNSEADGLKSIHVQDFGPSAKPPDPATLPENFATSTDSQRSETTPFADSGLPPTREVVGETSSKP